MHSPPPPNQPRAAPPRDSPCPLKAGTIPPPAPGDGQGTCGSCHCRLHHPCLSFLPPQKHGAGLGSDPGAGAGSGSGGWIRGWGRGWWPNPTPAGPCPERGAGSALDARSHLGTRGRAAPMTGIPQIPAFPPPLMGDARPPFLSITIPPYRVCKSHPPKSTTDGAGHSPDPTGPSQPGSRALGVWGMPGCTQECRGTLAGRRGPCPRRCPGAVVGKSRTTGSCYRTSVSSTIAKGSPGAGHRRHRLGSQAQPGDNEGHAATVPGLESCKK